MLEENPVFLVSYELVQRSMPPTSQNIAFTNYLPTMALYQNLVV
jgi:hypothetical protein